MGNRRSTGGLAWLVLACVLLVGWLAWSRGPVDPADLPAAVPAPTAAPAPVPAPQPGPAPASRTAAAVPALPPEALQTLALIRQGGPFPHRQDGGVFGNREGHLPRRSRGWYREYTVDTPGRRDRGARRIVTGGTPPSEWYYTDDHYDSFRRITSDGGTR